MRLKGEKARDRYIEDWEVVEFLSIYSKRKVGSVLAVQAYIRLKLLTGMRRGDMLRLTMSDLKEDGIHLKPGKTEDSTGEALIYMWSDELRKAVDAAKAARPVRLSPFLFFATEAEKAISMNKLAGPVARIQCGADLLLASWQKLTSRNASQSMTCVPNAPAMRLLWSMLSNYWHMLTKRQLNEFIDGKLSA